MLLKFFEIRCNLELFHVKVEKIRVAYAAILSNYESLKSTYLSISIMRTRVHFNIKVTFQTPHLYFQLDSKGLTLS